MATRPPLVLDDFGRPQELQVGDTIIGGSLPAATVIGQIVFSVDGLAFTPELPLVDDDGIILTDDEGVIVVDG